MSSVASPSLYRLAGPNATSQWVILPVLLLLSLNISDQVGFTDEQTLDFRKGLLLAAVAAWAVFTLSGLLIRLIPLTHERTRTAVVLTLYAVTEIVRTSLVHLFAVQFGVPSQANWAFRVTAAAASGIVFFSFVSVLVNDSRAYRSMFRVLHERREALRGSLQSIESILAQTRALMVEKVRTELAREVKAIDVEVQRGNLESMSLANEIIRLVDDVVRPTSHELYGNPVALANSVSTGKAPRINLRKILSATTTAQPFRPALMLLIGLALTVPLFLIIGSLPFFISNLLALALYVLVSWVAKRYLLQPLGRLQIAMRMLLISVIYVVPAVIFSAMVLASISGFGALSPALLAYGAAIGLILGWGLALVEGIRLAQQLVLVDSERANERLYWLNKRMQSEVWADQQNLAFALHHDVQASLLAAAMRLKLAVESGTEPGEVMALVTAAIEQALSENRRQPLVANPRELEDRINAKWDSVIHLEIDADQSATFALSTDPTVTKVVEDILLEFQINSIKHGQATKSSAHLTAPTLETLVLSVTNNGLGELSAKSAGLGSQFVDSVTLQHSFEAIEGGVRLECTLPLNRKLSAAQA